MYFLTLLYRMPQLITCHRFFLVNTIVVILLLVFNWCRDSDGAPSGVRQICVRQPPVSAAAPSSYYIDQNECPSCHAKVDRGMLDEHIRRHFDSEITLDMMLWLLDWYVWLDARTGMSIEACVVWRTFNGMRRLRSPDRGTHDPLKNCTSAVKPIPRLALGEWFPVLSICC